MYCRLSPSHKLPACGLGADKLAACRYDETEALMSSVCTLPRPEPSRDGPPAAPEAAATAVEFHYTQTDSFVALLHQLGASLLVSTYQANQLLVVRAAGGGLSPLVRTFDRPMGLAADPRRLALGTRNEIWLLRNAPDIAARIEPAGRHDACYLPRS